MNKFLFSLLACLMLCLLSKAGRAQLLSPRFENLDVNGGLSQNTVYVISQDKNGFIWIGTGDGLNRYDGSTVTSYKVRDVNDLYGRISKGNLLEDSEGNIWYGNDAGIFCWNKSKSQLSRRYETNRFLKSCLIDKGDILWLHDVGSKCIFSYNTKTSEIITFPDTTRSVQSPATRYVTASGNDHIWYATGNGKGLTSFDIRSHRFNVYLDGKTVDGIAAADSGAFALCADGSLYYVGIDGRIAPYGGLYNFRSGAECHDMVCDRFERLWIATHSGLLCYDLREKSSARYQYSDKTLHTLASNTVISLFIDRTDNLWVGTDGGGVSRLDLKPQFFEKFPADPALYPELKSLFVKCIYEDRNGNIWFGTNGSGLNILNTGTGAVTNQNQNARGKIGDIIGAVASDNAGRVWVGHSEGIGFFERGIYTPVPMNYRALANNNSSGFFYDIIPIASNELLAGTRLGLMAVRQNGRGFTVTDYFSDTALNRPMYDMELIGGDLWIAAQTRGLLRLRRDGDRWRLVQKLFTDKDIRCIHRDELYPSVIWISCGSGMIAFNTVTFRYKPFDESDGMQDTHVYGILEDHQHHIWISTNRGLLQYDRNKFWNYTYADGLQSNEFNTRSYHKGFSGKLYFGGVKGFNWFHSDLAKQGDPPVPVAITNIAIEDREVNADSIFRSKHAIEMTYNQNTIALTVAVLDYSSIKSNKIQYRLLGWDERWVLSPPGIIRYANLPPGMYTLEINASNGNNLWSSGLTLDIYVKAPFWKRTWFIGSLLILGITVLLASFKIWSGRKVKKAMRQLAQQKLLEAERERISREMHDDIGAGLTQITLMSEAIRSRKAVTGDDNQRIGEIADTSRQLVSNIGEIIWSLNPQQNTLEALLAYMREQMNKLLEYSGIDYKIDMPEVEGTIQLSNQQRRNIFLVTKEMVHNAIKHSMATQISVTAVLHADRLSFEVKDNGRGFDTSIGSNGNGLKNIRQRINEIRGTLELESAPGGGTVCSYSIPIHRTT